MGHEHPSCAHGRRGGAGGDDAPGDAGAGRASGGGGGDFRPGAPGVGDDYFPLYGNGGYDVKHYLLKVSYDPATDRLVGVATISARATQNLSSFNLDFVGLTVRSIKVNGRSAGWSADRPRAHRHPQARAAQGPQVHDRGPLRRGADHPADRARPRLHHRGRLHPHRRRRHHRRPARGGGQLVPGQRPPDRQGLLHLRGHRPADLEVVANGRLLARKRHGGKRTWLWNAPEPMASYLATVNSASSTPAATGPTGCGCTTPSTPTCSAEPSDPEDPASATFGEIADGSFARQGEILDFLERRFSRYPFSTGGGIVDDYDNLQFALETQTRPIYSKFFITSPPSGDSVVVHELAHQWFGDSVALAEWKHIWLNEGFAQYAEWMWSEEEAWAPPRSCSTPSTTGSRPPTRSGAWSSATPAPSCCSTTPCTSAGPWPSTPCASGRRP